MSVFKGPVVRHALEAGASGSVLVVEAKDATIKLTRPRRSVVHRDQRDDQVIRKLIEAAGLSAGFLATTQPTHAQLVQYQASDWDFILSRADVLGLIVVVDSGTVSLAKMAVAGAAKLRLEYGIDEIYNFELMLDASRQPEAVESVAWDQKNQAATQPYTAKDVKHSQGNIDGAKVAAKHRRRDLPVRGPGAAGPEGTPILGRRPAGPEPAIDDPGASRLPRQCQSQAAWTWSRSPGIGTRFNGKALVTGVRHRVDEGGWQTDVQFGLSPDWYCRRDDIGDPPRCRALARSRRGSRSASSTSSRPDPDKEYRVRVLLPTAERQAVRRLGPPGLARRRQGRGYFFRPEPGDEVVVGFFNNDPRQPIVLGALFGSKNAPPEDVSQLTDKNVHKAIVTRKGTTIGFVDEDKPSVYHPDPGQEQDHDRRQRPVREDRGPARQLDHAEQGRHRDQERQGPQAGG